MKKILLLGAYLVALGSSPLLAQTAAPSVAIVSVWYSGASAGAGHLSINLDGRTEAIEFAGGVNEKAYLGAAEVLRKAIAHLCQEGYILRGPFGKEELFFVKG